jgi:DNA-binding MarR family transcriptional regulator
VRRLHQLSVAIFHEAMKDLNLTPVQFGALTIIATNMGIEQSVLGEELGIDRVNAGDVVSRLIKYGLVHRKISSRDRRFKEVYLTDAGVKALQEGAQRMKQVQSRFLAPLNFEQQEIFLGLLLQLIHGNNDKGRALLRLPQTAEASLIDIDI